MARKKGMIGWNIDVRRVTGACVSVGTVGFGDEVKIFSA